MSDCVLPAYSSIKVELENVESRLTEVSRIATHFVELKDQINVKENEIKMLKQKLSGSSHGQLLQEIDNLKAIKGESRYDKLVLIKLICLNLI